MRFKARLFPLIDVMILMLGLFLVILARATLTEDPAAQVTEPPKETSEGGADASQVEKLKGVIVEFNATNKTWVDQESGRTIDSREAWDMVLGSRDLDPDHVVVVARIPREYGDIWTDKYTRQITGYVKGNCRSVGIQEY